MGILDRFKSKKEQELSDGAGSGFAGKGEAVDETVTPATEKEAKKKPAKAAKKATLVSERLSDVIVRPLVTEKSAVMAAVGQYMFVVTNDANRVEVRDAVRALYGIVPTSVNIQRVRGKHVRFGQRMGRRVSWKKAIVTLPKGKTIDVYEGV
jgi:large subunit ribosomal protein L23